MRECVKFFLPTTQPLKLKLLSSPDSDTANTYEDTDDEHSTAAAEDKEKNMFLYFLFICLLIQASRLQLGFFHTSLT